MGTLLVAVFLAALLVIEAGRRGLLPAPLAAGVPKSHFVAIGIVFGFLLGLEVIGLVFALAHSVANSLGKQFELLSLILLRKAFLEFSRFGEPIRWDQVAHAIPPILADVAGALVVFVLVQVFYRLQRHLPITHNEREAAGFACAKRIIALSLLAGFGAMAAGLGLGALRGRASASLFENFYTMLILSDVLIVLVSLRYTSEYRVIFRNSGFAAATVLIRVALTAPAYLNVALAVAAAALAIGVSWAYNLGRRRSGERGPLLA